MEQIMSVYQKHVRYICFFTQSLRKMSHFFPSSLLSSGLFVSGDVVGLEILISLTNSNTDEHLKVYLNTLVSGCDKITHSNKINCNKTCRFSGTSVLIVLLVWTCDIWYNDIQYKMVAHFQVVSVMLFSSYFYTMHHTVFHNGDSVDTVDGIREQRGSTKGNLLHLGAPFRKIY